MYVRKLAKTYGRKIAGVVAGTTHVCFQISMQESYGGTRSEEMKEKHQVLLKKVQKIGWVELGNKECKKVVINQVAEHVIKVARNLAKKYASEVTWNQAKKNAKKQQEFSLSVLTIDKKAYNSARLQVGLRNI